MAPKLYMAEVSPGVRAVLITAKALGIRLERHYVDIVAGETKTKEYLKLNPQHTVPTFIDDDGKILCDSHAIIVYLVEKYGDYDDSLYPIDPYKRALINQRLHFDSGCLFPPLRVTAANLFYKREKTIDPCLIEAANESWSFLETFLEGRRWLVGNEATLADISLVCTVTGMDILVPVDPKIYPNITAWVKRAETLPYYKEGMPGLVVGRKLRNYFLR